MLAKNRYLKHIVRTNSEVEFRDDTGGKARKVGLVYLRELGISRARFPGRCRSEPLIGLQAGNSILWDGSERRGAATYGSGNSRPPSQARCLRALDVPSIRPCPYICGMKTPVTLLLRPKLRGELQVPRLA